MTQTFEDILKAAAKLDGETQAVGEITVNVRPGTFVSKGVNKAGEPLARYKEGDVVRQVKVGSYGLQVQHILALFAACGVTSYDKAKLAGLLALPTR